MPFIIRRGLVQIIPFLAIIVFALAISYTCAFKTDTREIAVADRLIVTVARLDVQPNIITVGSPAIFYNGLCNETSKPVTVQLWMGAERVEMSGLSGERINLLTRESPQGPVPVTDTEEGRLRRALDKGCQHTEPIEIDEVQPTIPNGTWKLILHIVIPNKQDTTISSKQFTVQGAP